MARPARDHSLREFALGEGTARVIEDCLTVNDGEILALRLRAMVCAILGSVAQTSSRTGAVAGGYAYSLTAEMSTRTEVLRRQDMTSWDPWQPTKLTTFWKHGCGSTLCHIARAHLVDLWAMERVIANTLQDLHTSQHLSPLPSTLRACPHYLQPLGTAGSRRLSTPGGSTRFHHPSSVPKESRVSHRSSFNPFPPDRSVAYGRLTEMVTWVGSPPKLEMCRCTHSNAARWSCRPALATPSDMMVEEARKPRRPSRYWMLTATMPPSDEASGILHMHI
jgi:hypothetical protein